MGTGFGKGGITRIRLLWDGHGGAIQFREASISDQAGERLESQVDTSVFARHRSSVQTDKSITLCIDMIFIYTTTHRIWLI